MKCIKLIISLCFVHHIVIGQKYFSLSYPTSDVSIVDTALDLIVDESNTYTAIFAPQTGSVTGVRT